MRSKALSGFLGVAGGQVPESIGKDEVLHPEVSHEDLVSLDSLVQEERSQTLFGSEWSNLKVMYPEGIDCRITILQLSSFHLCHSLRLQLLAEVTGMFSYVAWMLAMFILFIKLLKWLLLGKGILQTQTFGSGWPPSCL